MKASAPVSIKLVSLNIERSKHLDIVLPFLGAQKPDVVCVQEILKNDIMQFVATLGGAEYVFAPAFRHMETPDNPIVGEAIFSRLRIVRKDIRYYVGNANDVPESSPSEAAKTGRSPKNCALVTAEVEKEGSMFIIGTTHFTWSPAGMATSEQRINMRKLLGTLEMQENLVLTGDFNAPRGGEIFSMLADRYKDNVPAHYTTSIDGNLHRAGQLDLMVDGLFSTPGYAVSNVRMICGVSDHCALSAEISRN